MRTEILDWRAIRVCWVPLLSMGGLLSFEPSDWSGGYFDLLLGEIGNILERGSGVGGSLPRGFGSLRKGVGIMLMRDDVMKQEGETLE